MTKPIRDDRSTRQVPTFDSHVYRAKQANYCLCIMVLNEGGLLQLQLERTHPYLDIIDVIVADGGSSDGSIAHNILDLLGVNTLLVKTSPGKLGAQMRMAFAWALDRGYKGIICVDGNNKDGPDAIPRFLDKLEAGYDHVQGSRFLPGGTSKNLPLIRWLGLRLVHAPLISLASQIRYTDTTNGFRAFSRRLLEDRRIDVFRDVFSGYELHYYLAIRAARLGFRICEIPVSRRYPKHGPTPTKISPLKGNLQVLKCLLDSCLGTYDPPGTV